jgi:hypothetical protein
MLSRAQTPKEKPGSAAELEELAEEDYDASGLFCANGHIPEYEEVCEMVDSPQDGKQQGRRRAFFDGGLMVTSTNDKSILHRLKKITFEKFLGDAGKKSSYQLKERDTLWFLAQRVD